MKGRAYYFIGTILFKINVCETISSRASSVLSGSKTSPRSLIVKETPHLTWEEISLAEQKKENSNKSRLSCDDRTTKEFSSFSSFKPVQFNPGSFLEGESVLVLPNIVNEKDCEYIVQAAIKDAEKFLQERIKEGFPAGSEKGLIRLPTVGAAERATKSKTPCAKPLSCDTDKVLMEIFNRVLGVIDKELPLLTQSIFETNNKGNNGPLKVSFSFEQCHIHNKLTFASREPAVNVYTPGGQFHAHTDGQEMTILIPLNDDFGGGGTAFWSESLRHRVDPPSVVIKPSRGSALLFNGQVMHSGLQVQSGTRVVFVASFSVIR